MKKIYQKFQAFNKKNSFEIFEMQLESLKKLLSTLPEIVEIIVKPLSLQKPRSLAENAYYWSVVLSMIAEHTGYEKEEVHEILKNIFLRKEYNIGVDVVFAPVSTASLTTIEMEEYLDRIRRFAASELDLYIPEPNEIETDIN
jgi:hypothetical protein